VFLDAGVLTDKAISPRLDGGQLIRLSFGWLVAVIKAANGPAAFSEPRCNDVMPQKRVCANASFSRWVAEWFARIVSPTCVINIQHAA